MGNSITATKRVSCIELKGFVNRFLYLFIIFFSMSYIEILLRFCLVCFAMLVIGVVFIIDSGARRLRVLLGWGVGAQ
jgi:hypothetical protein